MKKISFVLAALLTSVSLNAAVVATVDGKNITDTEINELLQGQGKQSKLAQNPRAVAQKRATKQRHNAFWAY